MLFGLIIAALAFLRRRIEWGTGWMWPVPTLRLKDGVTYSAVISDGVGSPRGELLHRGVDIMFRRRNKGDRPEYASGTVQGTPLFFAPQLTPIVAARDGKIWSAGKTPRGWSVVIDHGKPFATYYTHMAALAIAPHVSGKSIATGKPTFVRAGDVIGVMGGDPMDPRHLVHLHFSVAHNGPPESAAVDPQEAMQTWQRKTIDFGV